jgi:hypothetical protein
VAVPQPDAGRHPLSDPAERTVCGASRARELPCPNDPDTCGRHCGARLKQSEGFCARPPLRGRKRCRLHGGASPPPGPDHPTYRHGGHSRYHQLLGNGDLHKHYTAVIRDKDLLTLHDEVALVQTFINRRVQRLAAGNGAASAAKVAQAWRDFKAASNRKDMAAMEAAGNDLDRLVAGLTDEEAQEQRVVELAQEKKMLVKAELDRMAELRQVATLPHVLMLLSNVWNAVLAKVSRVDERRAVAAEFAALVGKNSPLVTVLPEAATVPTTNGHVE